MDLAHGVSFHSVLADSQRTRSRFKALRAKRIAQMGLVPRLGKMKETEAASAKSHMTVWFKESAEAHLEFVCDAEVAK